MFITLNHAAKILGLKPSQARKILPAPDKIVFSPGRSERFDIKKILEIKEKIKRKEILSKQNKQTKVNKGILAGDRVCIECGKMYKATTKYPTRCSYCVNGLPRLDDPCNVLKVHKFRSKKCDCGQPILVGFTKCQDCARRQKNNILDIYEVYGHALISN